MNLRRFNNSLTTLLNFYEKATVNESREVSVINL